MKARPIRDRFNGQTEHYIECLNRYCTYLENKNEQLRLHSVVKSLPTIKERDIELSEMLENYYEDDERQFKKEFKFGFKHCFKWMHDKMSV